MPFEPKQEDSTNIMRDLNSDPLYIRLCQAQECFRARLTPKPWRCGMKSPPTEFPWENRQAEGQYRQWEQKYNNTAINYSVCRLIKQVGPTEIHPEIRPIMELHDKMTCSENNLKLA